MTETLQQRLDAIAEREAKATPGPWGVHDDQIHNSIREKKRGSCTYGDPKGWAISILVRPDDYYRGDGNETEAAQERQAKRDRAFISHARTDVPLLLRLCQAFAKPLSRAELQAAMALLEADKGGDFAAMPENAYNAVMARRAEEVLRDAR